MCDEKTFDELVELFKTDPEAFEEYRKQRLEQEIVRICADCPEKEDRCRAFVWRMEQELSNYKDPLARYNKMVEMFWAQVEEFKRVAKYMDEPPETPHNAEILDFPKKTK